MAENWKSVIGYEGIYEVSDKGQVRTADGKTTQSALHGTRHWRQRTLKPKDTWAKGHTVWCGKRVTLWKDKKPKDYLVHRLEACSFYGIPLDTDLTVNHKDGDRTNNTLSNLELITREDNIRHGYKTGLYESRKTPITLIDEIGNEYSFESISMMNRTIGSSRSSYKGRKKVSGRDGTVYNIARYGK